MKELGKRWKELPDDKREEYKDQYEDEKRRIIDQAKGTWAGEEEDDMDDEHDMEDGEGPSPPLWSSRVHSPAVFFESGDVLTTFLFVYNLA
jgi:hypothetical protein